MKTCDDNVFGARQTKAWLLALPLLTGSLVATAARGNWENVIKFGKQELKVLRVQPIDPEEGVSFPRVPHWVSGFSVTCCYLSDSH